MALKIDGTNSKLIFLAGTGNATTLASNLSAVPFTLTLPASAGLSGQALLTDGSGNLYWGAVGGGSINVVNDTVSTAPINVVFSTVTSGSLSTVYTSSPNCSFNPFTGVLSARQMQSTQGIFLNANTITSDYTVPANTNGLSAGPMLIPPGVTVSLDAGSNWSVV